MTMHCQSPPKNHYSLVDEWRAGGQGNHADAEILGPSFSRTPRPATCPSFASKRTIREHDNSRNCCRTTNIIPHGSHFPIGETLDSYGEWKPTAKPVKHLEYGYQASWRPSRGVVPIKDIMEPCVVTPAKVEFRPSIKVIDAGTGAWSEKWKASKRYIDPGHGKDFEWRPCIRTSHPHKRGHEAVYRPQVRPDPANSSLETNEGYLKPIRQHLAPYTPIRQRAPYQQKKHIIVPPEWVPPFRIQGEDYNTAPKRLGRGRILDYCASNAPLSLGWESQDRPETAPCKTDQPGLPRNMRRYIASGHLSHFEDNNCCVCKVGLGDNERRTLRNHSASGPYHETVRDRNPIVGHMPKTDVLVHPKVSQGPSLFGPAGSINSDIIDHKFSDLRQEKTPISEMKDQFRRWEATTENKF